MMLVYASLWFVCCCCSYRMPNPWLGRLALVGAGVAQALSMVPLSTMC